jgi:hypothetical protein
MIKNKFEIQRKTVLPEVSYTEIFFYGITGEVESDLDQCLSHRDHYSNRNHY